MKKNITVICGLIGAGKTTYATTHFRNVTDLDAMNPYARKRDQIAWTMRLLRLNNSVCHITTYPTDEELRAFEPFETRWILIETGVNQCKTNILIRGRKRDLEHLYEVTRANQEYAREFQTSSIPFEHAKLFGAH